MTITATVYAKMHTADPGPTGGTAAAVNTTRKQITFKDGVVPVSGTGGDDWGLVQATAVVYSTGEVTATETYAWVSFWDAPTGGNHLANQDIANQAATLSTALTIAAGTIILSDKVDVENVLRTAIAADRVNHRMHRTRRGSFLANAASRQRDKFATQSPQTI